MGLSSFLLVKLTLIGVASALVTRPMLSSPSVSRRAAATPMKMIFGKKEDPWEAMQKRGKKSMEKGLNDGDDPYANVCSL